MNSDELKQKLTDWVRTHKLAIRKGCLIVLVVCGFLIATNPSKQVHIETIKQECDAYMREESPGLTWWGYKISDISNSILGICYRGTGNDILQRARDEKYFIYKNYSLFSCCYFFSPKGTDLVSLGMLGKVWFLNPTTKTVVETPKHTFRK